MAFSRQESREPLSGLLPKAVIAGCVLGAVGLIARATIAPSAGATYVTAVGGTQQISLSDGSVLDVNTDSKVRVRFTDGRRQIHLDRGELRLRVAHDPSRPLEVLAGGITTRAIGTVFTVRLHEDARVETLVTEGRVVVLREQKLLGIPVTATPLSRTLAAGEKVIVDGKSASVSRASQKEVQRKLMWTTGKIAFEGEVLADVVNELNRYTVRKLVIRDPKIARTSLGGGFDTANAEAYAAEISRYFGPQKLVLVPPEAQGRSGPGRATTR